MGHTNTAKSLIQAGPLEDSADQYAPYSDVLADIMDDIDEQYNGSYYLDAQVFIPLWVEPSSDGPGLDESGAKTEGSPGDGNHLVVSGGSSDPARIAIQMISVSRGVFSARLENQNLNHQILWPQHTHIPEAIKQNSSACSDYHDAVEKDVVLANVHSQFWNKTTEMMDKYLAVIVKYASSDNLVATLVL
mmetsp:Transcript_24454/g.38566  ORF Transcript_24454/g.38566 Transcript_24454/m.38566 type:complete len:190 (-) Transcript_24454:6-575(-)